RITVCRGTWARSPGGTTKTSSPRPILPTRPPPGPSCWRMSKPLRRPASPPSLWVKKTPGPACTSGPGVFFTQRDGGDAGRLKGFDILQQLGPGGGRVGNIGLGEEVFVVPPGDLAHVPRHTVIL